MFACTHICLCMSINVICTYVSSSSKPHGRGANNSTMKPHELFLAQRTFKMFIEKLAGNSNFDMNF